MAFQPLQRCLRLTLALPKVSFRKHSTSRPTHETDFCGIPVRPTWSVNQLLSSYPSPKLSPTTINRLYELSALIPPKEGTPQYKAVAKDLEEMVRLVEAVRLVDTSGISVTGRGEKEDADRENFSLEDSEETGHALLKHASRTQDQFYVVDSERRR
ncbi:hypothetical protein BDZ97DRAFT_1911830 [Flammula alnicola]|nr:hypothetical protein BDZ97DRAFT_1911830 [Flammula alnicola]